MQIFEILKGEKVLVTGGAGFIGSNLVKKLLKIGCRVTVLDDFFTGREENLPEDKNLKIVRGSVTDKETVEGLVKENPLIFHLAARNIIVSTKNPEEDFNVNIGGTLNILMAARQFGAKRIVYTSSVSVYGNPKYLPINEDDSINLLSPYAVSKFSGEGYCKAFYESYSVPVTILRYSNVYGIGQWSSNPYCGVVAKFFEQAINSKNIQIHGDGEQTRDFTFVDDVIDATILASLSPKAEGEVYNVGSGIETSVNELANNIIDVTSSSSKIEYIDRRDIDNIRRRVLNIERIRKDLRWVPKTTLKEGLKKTYCWLINGKKV